MKENYAIVFPEAKKAVIEELDIPKPGQHQILIKTSLTMVSTGTEMTAFAGEFPPGSTWEKFFSYPFYPGYSNIGIVVEVGPGVDKNLIGKRVATANKHAAYVLEDVNPAVLPEELMSGRMGFFDIPENIPDEHAVFFTLAEIVMNGIRNSKVQWGECAVVFGLGLLGQLTVRFCRQCGAAPVFGVDIVDSRLKFLPEDNAVISLNSAKQDVNEVVKQYNHGRPADVVFEVTGNASLIEKELTVLRKKGRLLLLSSPRQKVSFDFHDYCNWPSYTIIGSHNFSHPVYPQPDNPWTIRRHVELFFDLLIRGELDIDCLISRKVEYTKAPEIYSHLLTDRSQDMGIIFTFN